MQLLVLPPTNAHSEVTGTAELRLLDEGHLIVIRICNIGSTNLSFHSTASIAITRVESGRLMHHVFRSFKFTDASI